MWNRIRAYFLFFIFCFNYLQFIFENERYKHHMPVIMAKGLVNAAFPKGVDMIVKSSVIHHPHYHSSRHYLGRGVRIYIVGMFTLAYLLIRHILTIWTYPRATRRSMAQHQLSRRTYETFFCAFLIVQFLTQQPICLVVYCHVRFTTPWSCLFLR